MDTIEAIRTRRSTRKFLSDTLPREVLEQIVDAARLAPTARNEQPWEFVVITDPTMLKEIGALADHGPFIAEASACIAVFCRESKYYLEDGCAATENILLAATALGVDSCWVAGDKKDYCSKVAEMLGMPADQKLISLNALGYRAAGPKNPPKRELADVLHWDKYGR